MLCRSRQQKAMRALAAVQPVTCCRASTATTSQPMPVVTVASCIRPTETDTDLNTCSSSAKDVKHLEDIFSPQTEPLKESPSIPSAAKTSCENSIKLLNSASKLPCQSTSTGYKLDIAILLSDEILSRPSDEYTTSKDEEDTFTSSKVSESVVKSPGEMLWKFNSHSPKSHCIRRTQSLPDLRLAEYCSQSPVTKEEVAILLDDIGSQSQVVQDKVEPQCSFNHNIHGAISSLSTPIAGPNVVELVQKVYVPSEIVEELKALNAACNSYRLESHEALSLSSMGNSVSMAQSVIPWTSQTKSEEFHLIAWGPLAMSANVVTRYSALLTAKKTRVSKRRSATHSGADEIYVTLSLKKTESTRNKQETIISSTVSSDLQTNKPLDSPPTVVEKAVESPISVVPSRLSKISLPTTTANFRTTHKLNSELEEPKAIERCQLSAFHDDDKNVLFLTRKSRRGEDNEKKPKSVVSLDNYRRLFPVPKTNKLVEKRAKPLRELRPRSKSSPLSPKHNIKKKASQFSYTNYLRSTINAGSAVKPMDSNQRGQTKATRLERSKKSKSAASSAPEPVVPAHVQLSEDEPSYVLDLVSCSSDSVETIACDPELLETKQLPLTTENNPFQKNFWLPEFWAKQSGSFINNLINFPNRAGSREWNFIMPAHHKYLGSPYRSKSVAAPVNQATAVVNGKDVSVIKQGTNHKVSMLKQGTNHNSPQTCEARHRQTNSDRGRKHCRSRIAF